MGILRETRVFIYLGEAKNPTDTEFTTPDKPGPTSQKPQERGLTEESACSANILWLSTRT